MKPFVSRMNVYLSIINQIYFLYATICFENDNGDYSFLFNYIESQDSFDLEKRELRIILLKTIIVQRI